MQRAGNPDLADTRRAGAFHVVVVVWGEEFRRLFLEVCVPNQLTPGNLGALPAGSRYRVFTSSEDVPVFRSSAMLHRVEQLMPVDIVGARHLSASGKNRFSRMTACHRQALVDARKANAALIFLCADHVVSEGAVAAVVRQHRRGMRAAVCTGIRVERDGLVAALHARGGVGGVPPRELVSIALDHLHPFTHAHVADGRRTALEPISVYWNVPGEGLLARCYHLHPLMIDPLRPDELPQDTIDGHYVRRACPRRSQVHVVSDSDELVLFEMSGAAEAVPGTAAGGMSLWRTSTMIGRSDSHQQWYWSHPIRIHARDLGDSWRAIEERSARFARRVLTLCLVRRWLTPRHLVRIFRRDGLLGKPLRSAVRTRAKRLRRSASLTTHVVRRGAQRLRKRAGRAGRRFVRRVRPA